jgi:hypothetical protein
MHHTVAWSGTVATTANTKVAALSDQVVAIQNGNFVWYDQVRYIGLFAAAALIVRARLNVPSYRLIAPMQIRPVNGAASPINNPNIMDLRDDPLSISVGEEQLVEATSSTGTSETVTVVGIVQTNPMPTPSGQRYVIRATGTATLVASTWTDVPLTYDDTLPTGTYEIVGAECVSATIVAFRLILDQINWRPGALGLTNVQNRQSAMFAPGELGSWGRFRSNSLPRLQALAIAADTAETLYLHIVQTSRTLF